MWYGMCDVEGDCRVRRASEGGRLGFGGCWEFLGSKRGSDKQKAVRKERKMERGRRLDLCSW